ncbi:MAG: ATP-binding cassette domain-containing protein, partial [Spirulina sp.]
MRSQLTSPPKTIISPPELEVRNLSKYFGHSIALDNVSMTLKSGRFHALLGENGAGKSTLVKCIMGFYHADRGDILIGGRSRRIDNPRDAHQFGIGMVYQQFTSIPAMTVAENLVLSRRDRRFFINWKREYQHLSAFMATSPFHLPLKTPVEQLAAGQKQKLEILKQLYLKSRILILD